jgi:hypothetical protein
VMFFDSDQNKVASLHFYATHRKHRSSNEHAQWIGCCF